MPIYSIKCKDCNDVSDKLVKHQDVNENGNVTNNTCDKCGSEYLVKLFDLEGGCFHLAGSGWYKDGY